MYVIMKKKDIHKHLLYTTELTKRNPENKLQSGKGTKDLRLWHSQKASAQRQQFQGWRFLQTYNHTLESYFKRSCIYTVSFLTSIPYGHYAVRVSTQKKAKGDKIYKAVKI